MHLVFSLSLDDSQTLRLLNLLKDAIYVCNVKKEEEMDQLDKVKMYFLLFLESDSLSFIASYKCFLCSLLKSLALILKMLLHSGTGLVVITVVSFYQYLWFLLRIKTFCSRAVEDN
ncbi:hypothetical protein Golob_010702 [Gossypium lobatum]|uniref:Uncharacterized protein n=1 Tax=Gossypium lobatum TaxID=34289 RepID=A0A7J8MMB4_9ROSI|nr:hypothetical protein [Gossypium lobatum]